MVCSSVLIFATQSGSAQTQFEFYYRNKPSWNSTVYLVEDAFNQENVFNWTRNNNESIEVSLPRGVNEASRHTEPGGDWGEGVVTLAIDHDLDIGTSLLMCMYGSEEDFSYQDERCEYSSISKLRIAIVQIDLSPH